MGRTYTPAETVAAEAAVRHYARRAFGERQPFDGPVALSCAFVFAPAPSSRVAAGDWHCGQGDVDNFCKLVLDALNPLPKKARPDGWESAWRDDRQVAKLTATKNWASEIDPEGTTVRVEKL